jgi:hypothetical protein
MRYLYWARRLFTGSDVFHTEDTQYRRACMSVVVPTLETDRLIMRPPSADAFPHYEEFYTTRTHRASTTDQ